MRGTSVVEALKTVHPSLGRWYWFFRPAITPLTFHAGEHGIFMFLRPSPASGTIAGQRFSQLGFLL